MNPPGFTEEDTSGEQMAKVPEISLPGSASRDALSAAKEMRSWLNTLEIGKNKERDRKLIAQVANIDKIIRVLDTCLAKSTQGMEPTGKTKSATLGITAGRRTRRRKHRK